MRGVRPLVIFALGIAVVGCAGPTRTERAPVAVELALGGHARIVDAELIRDGDETVVTGHVACKAAARCRVRMTVTRPDGGPPTERDVRPIPAAGPRPVRRDAWFVADAGRNLPDGAVIRLRILEGD